MTQPTDGWPELTYAYVKHYFWEPQHLTHTEASIDKAQRKAKALGKAQGKARIDAVDELLRTEEVPLNYLLNILLRIAPASLRSRCLEPFGIDTSLDPGLDTLALKTPVSTDGIQPDVQLESDWSRVFIELKVDASIKLEQIKKYVRRHEELNKHPGTARRPYVLLLMNRDSLRLTGLTPTIPFTAIDQLVPRLQEEDPGMAYADEVTFGVTNWRMFAEALERARELRRGEQTDSAEMLEVLVGDFLADLKARPNVDFG